MAMLEQTEISERRACLLVELSRTVFHYAPRVQPENEQLQGRMVELASERRRFGYGFFIWVNHDERNHPAAGDGRQA